MPYDAKAVANSLLDLAETRGKSLDQMQVQKLVYYAHGWHLAIKNEPLIAENVQAWAYGPVIRSLYDALRGYGKQPILGRCVESNFGSDGNGELMVEEYTPSIHDDPQQIEFTSALLERIWEVYGRYSGVQLSNKTHAEGSPWKEIFDRFDGKIPPGVVIAPEKIRDYFQSVAEARAAHGSLALERRKSRQRFAYQTQNRPILPIHSRPRRSSLETNSRKWPGLRLTGR